MKRLWCIVANAFVADDPDRANPTRPRMERPLETIMSFQRAAEYTDSTRRSPYSGGPGLKDALHPDEWDINISYRIEDGLLSPTRP